MMVEYTVVLEEGESGYWVASVPALHGGHTQGTTREQALERLHEAIDLCLEDDASRGSGHDPPPVKPRIPPLSYRKLARHLRRNGPQHPRRVRT